MIPSPSQNCRYTNCWLLCVLAVDSAKVWDLKSEISLSSASVSNALVWGSGKRKKKNWLETCGGKETSFTYGSILLRCPGSWSLEISLATLLEILAKIICHRRPEQLTQTVHNKRGFSLSPYLWLRQLSYYLSVWKYVCFSNMGPNDILLERRPKFPWSLYVGMIQQASQFPN